MTSAFDDLARTLATPMPRSRALRTLGAALAIGAFPALRPDRAVGSAVRTQDDCPGQTVSCSIPNLHNAGCYYPDYERCCKGPNNDKVHPNEMSWRCPKDDGCGVVIPGGSTASTCTCTNRCKDGKCCPRNKGRCVKGTCCPAIRTTFAPRTNNKGAACCPPGTIAVPGAVGHCCPKGDMGCCRPADSGDPDDLLVPLARRLKRGQLCVKGQVRRA